VVIVQASSPAMTARPMTTAATAFQPAASNATPPNQPTALDPP
jgi:hypothetical protein